jgi:regulator of replication initiation timing
MDNKIEKINQLLDDLEKLIAQKNFVHKDLEVMSQLLEENKLLKTEYQHLKETSQEVINELNSSVQIIEDYFKKQNANSKNI